MKSREIAEDYLYRAKRCLKEAGIALADEDYPAVVRRSQEALELAVKALLRHHAIEYPREHDVSDALQNLRGKVMHRLEEMLPQIAALMSELAKLRGPAMYGYEREGIPPRKIFTRNYAVDVYNSVCLIVDLASSSMNVEGS